MDDNMAMVVFQPSGVRGAVPKGITVLEASRLLGVDIEALCGEKKVCGKCKVRIEQGCFEKFGIESKRTNVTRWEAEEDRFIDFREKEAGYRLSCVTRIQGDLLVFVPEQSRAGKQVVSKAYRNIHIEHDPAVRIYYVRLDPPTFEDPTGDLERVCRALERQHGLKNLNVDLFALRQLPVALRGGDWGVTVSVWNQKEIIRFRPGKTERAYGLAIDIGTTTIAAYLCDLLTMQVVDTVSMMNPQCKYGEDVMARITYHMTTPDGLRRMSDDLIEGLNFLIDQAIQNTHPPSQTKAEQVWYDGMETSKETKADLRLTTEDIEDLAIGGNTAMHHILLQLNPEFLGLAPFPPAIHRSLDIKARDLGIRINPAAYLFVLPIEAGFVGADNVGVLIAEEPYTKEEMQLIIDIGTNGELVLGNKDKIISASCATGPAFEGAQISCGMRAAPGAIERIEIDAPTKFVNYKVIGRDAWRKYSEPKDMQAKGICGSGILDLLAELYRSGVITKSGAFNKAALKGNPHFRINPNTRQPEFVLAWAEETSIGKDIVVSQKDIRQVQLAKGALYAGCKLMLKRMGLEKADVVKIAGAFGSHVDRTKALIMGLFPDCEIQRIQSIGNAAGDGCRAALLNLKKRAEANWVARHVEYIELTLESTFQQDFVEALQIPHMKDQFPHLRGIVPDEVLDQ